MEQYVMFHLIEKILIHMPGFQSDDLGGERPQNLFLDPQPVDQFFPEEGSG